MCNNRSFDSNGVEVQDKFNFKRTIFGSKKMTRIETKFTLTTGERTFLANPVARFSHDLMNLLYKSSAEMVVAIDRCDTVSLK